ncbi:DUF945 domain-containing protein [Bibersteinia trehalosi]|uniref:DUF945 domain-containing protein n=1 Tax=Bibersteinia trehalosi TaxID=47735 RepID=A0A3R8NGE2_BIBTR|nr:YdgA family protein [Bibersteinia trehalosi]RRN02638.1 DUF945 domain-containing protein [Bibersteinia trehalosi]
MKFSKIALSVAAIVSVIAVGGSWYTGKQAESRYQQLVELSNKQLKGLESHGIFAEIKDVKLERHFFSSDVAYRLEAKVDGEKFVVDGQDKLYHGPFPLNRLSQFKLFPVVASLQSKFTLPEQWQQKLQRTELGEGVADFAYSGAIDGVLHVPALSYQEDMGDKLELADVTMKYSYHQNLNGGQGEISTDLVKLSDDYGSHTEISGVTYHFDYKPNSNYALLGDSNAKVNVKQIKGGKGDSIEIKDFELDFDGKVEGERALSDVLLSFKSLMVNGTNNFGSMQLKSDWNVDAALYQQFLDLSASGEVETEIVGDVMLKLLAKQASFNVKALKLENNGGKANSALSLNFNTFSPEEFTNTDLTNVLKALRQSSLDVALDRDYVAHLMQAGGDSKEDAQKAAEEFFATLKMFSLVSQEENRAKLALSIDNGKVTLNGKELSDDDLQGLLFMLAMMAAF